MNYRKTPITEAIDNIKIGQLTEKEFMKFMERSCDLYAIPKISDKNSLRVIYDFFNKSFSALTYQELDLALVMNLNGLFKNTVEPFGKFSSPFVAKIIEQYRPVRQHELKHSILPDANPRTVTDAEKVHDEFIESCLKMKEVLICNNWGLIFEHIEKLGLVDDNKILKLRTSERADITKHNRGITASEIAEKLEVKIKKLICQDYAFQKLKANGVVRCSHDI